MTEKELKTITTTADGEEVEENLQTGVIYRIKNLVDNKIYIGRAYSYVKNGSQEIRRHGAEDRLYKHFKAARNGSTECPLLYNAMWKYGQKNFIVETLRVCSKKHLKERETTYIKKYKSFLPEIGYNYTIGDNKPTEGENKIKYEAIKAKSNRDRCQNGSQRKAEGTSNLPANIYYAYRKDKSGNKVIAGYKVQIRDSNRKLHMKGFTKNSLSLDEKLQQAKDSLVELKEQLGLVENNDNNEDVDPESDKVEKIVVKSKKKKNSKKKVIVQSKK